MVKRSLVNSVTNYYIFLTGLPSCENHTACHSDRLAPISGKMIGLMRRDDAAVTSVTILAKIEGSDRELQLELSESF